MNIATMYSLYLRQLTRFTLNHVFNLFAWRICTKMPLQFMALTTPKCSKKLKSTCAHTHARVVFMLSTPKSVYLLPRRQSVFGTHTQTITIGSTLHLLLVPNQQHCNVVFTFQCATYGQRQSPFGAMFCFPVVRLC